MHRPFFVLLALTCFAGPATATTWDEPWQREVVEQADTLGLFEVISIDGLQARVRSLNSIAGEATPPEFSLSVDPSTRYASVFGNEQGEFAFREGQRVYLFPKHSQAGWTIPTPTAGADVVRDDGVAATYRISAHQALQPSNEYEALQRCIFQHVHGASCDEAKLENELDAPLTEPPAALSATATAAEQRLFFRQHVALESAYLLERDIPLATLEPFLKADFFHTQLSAVRALAASKAPERNARLIAFIKDPSRLPMAQAMAVLMVAQIKDKALIDQLKAWADQAPTADSSLPIDIMDPRVATQYPSTVRDAIREL